MPLLKTKHPKPIFFLNVDQQHAQSFWTSVVLVKMCVGFFLDYMHLLDATQLAPWLKEVKLAH